jgi:Terpene cyclase DEP1
MNQSTPREGKTQGLYLLLAILGAVLPLRYFFRFLFNEGPNASLFFQQLFQTDVSAIFAMDVMVSAVALWVFVLIEGRRRRMKFLWVYIVGTMLVGVSFALPLFLFFRERHSA